MGSSAADHDAVRMPYCAMPDHDSIQALESLPESHRNRSPSRWRGPPLLDRSPSPETSIRPISRRTRSRERTAEHLRSSPSPDTDSNDLASDSAILIPDVETAWLRAGLDGTSRPCTTSTVRGRPPDSEWRAGRDRTIVTPLRNGSGEHREHWSVRATSRRGYDYSEDGG